VQGNPLPRITDAPLSQDVLLARFRLACLPSSPFWARRYTQDVLGKWRMPEDVIETAELLVSELVTNAAKFGVPGPGRPRPFPGAGIVDIVLRHLPGRVVIEVWDANPNPPIPDGPDLDAESGRGLMLVQALSKEWSYFFPESGGKIVYCVIEVNEAQHALTGDHLAATRKEF
jgi:anti-sigma regulatory factor (Ser/Thr protein kinase)